MESKPKGAFNVQAFLGSSGVARRIVEFRRSDVIFGQGDACDSVLYIHRGGVRLSVVSKGGREAIVAMLGPGDFFGEGCLAGVSVHTGSATAIAPMDPRRFWNAPASEGVVPDAAARERAYADDLGRPGARR